jgi:hypothetical protein
LETYWSRLRQLYKGHDDEVKLSVLFEMKKLFFVVPLNGILMLLVDEFIVCLAGVTLRILINLLFVCGF